MIHEQLDLQHWKHMCSLQRLRDASGGKSPTGGAITGPCDIAVLEQLRDLSYAHLPDLKRVPTDIFIPRDAQRGAYSAEMSLQAHSTCPFWNETSKCPDSLESMFRKTRRLFFVRLVDQSKGPATEHLAAHKPQLRRRRPVWEEPPSPSHDVGHN